MSRRATVVGVGLIGGSIGMALREAGWHVSGVDADEACCTRGLELGALDAVGWDPAAEVTFVAVPVGMIAGLVGEALDASPAGFVTDAGSVKAAIVEAVDDPRFVGGHPMAGSEQDGIEGADASMFRGANWVLTPGAATADDAFAGVRSVVRSLDAEVVTLSPERHDALVALVSHVPHLTAASLVGLAARRSEEHSAVLRLAAGGFRDMTRIAAGHPGIWPDICAENRTAITGVLDDLIGALGEVRREVVESDEACLLERLESARAARLSLPTGAPPPSDLLEVRVPVLDRKGEIASVAALATDLDVNIYDLEIAHSAEGDRGVIVLIVDAPLAGRLTEGLEGLDYRPTSRPLAQG
ncbi:MAG: prephenate dehydrogenase/arogenate dehydrogenase family protein [Acidimicrobiales bacterium]|nr:prephenate dehydrogenase/arogenate dehydrogenase family protein [Acidimicrobiales bacterium]MDP6648540.1 prephenate dehydrogenase/arogenate dehydrogenase family protein [Acidimicrobiales bacterium]MDP6760849.1 prephenate dehydrogenase/arogenate dehydrogenase family protein [Acidimicrobiales bacterium]